MTKPDLETVEDTFDAKRYWLHLLEWSVLLSFVAIALIVTFVAAQHLAGGGSTADIVMIAVGAPITLIGGYYLWRKMPDFTMGEPQTARGKRVRWLLVAVIAVGLAIAFPIIFADDGDNGATLFGNGQMPLIPAMIAVAIWTLATPILIFVGRRNSDEHAIAVHDFGMMVGFQVFAYAAPIWWMCWRAGVLPQPDVMILFVVTGIIVNITIIWKRSI